MTTDNNGAALPRDPYEVLGYVPDAYGRHVIRGKLLSRKSTYTGSEKQVSMKVLLGRGEWDGIELVAYDGAEISPSNYEFFNGGYAPVPDSRFSDEITNGGIARYSVTLPAGISDDEDASKLAAVVRCKKLLQYDAAGNASGPVYSTNPADQFLDAIREDSLQKGLTFSERVDFQNYLDAWYWCAETLTYPDYSKVPRNMRVTRLSGGSLTIGTWAISVQAYNDSGEFSQRTAEATIVSQNTTRSFAVSGEGTEGATGYRIWFRNLVVPATYYYVDSATTSTTITSTSGVSTGTPGAATGAFLLTQPRMESHAAFPQATDLETVLNSICLQAGCDWQKVGKKYLLLLPHNRASVHTFTVANTRRDSFKFWHLEPEKRINRIICNFREATDPYLRPAPPVVVDRPARQGEGVLTEYIQLWGMARHQAMRVMSLRMKAQYDRTLHVAFEDDGSAAHVLPGDVVTVVDAGSGINTTFVVLEIELPDSDRDDCRKFICRQWSNSDYADSDGDNLPTTSIYTTERGSQFDAPPPVESLTPTSAYEVRSDGTVNGYIKLSVQFAPHTVRTFGRLYHQKPASGVEELLGILAPDPATGLVEYRLDLAQQGTHNFRVQVYSAVGVEQSTPSAPTVFEMPLYLVAPPRTATMTGARVNNVVRWSWDRLTQRNVAGYRVTDDSGTLLATVDGTTWDEPLPTAAVTRRVYSIDTNGNVSTLYRTATYTPDQPNNGTTFTTPVGSVGYMESLALDNAASAVETPFFYATAGGTFDVDTRVFTKTASSGYNAGVVLDRALAYGDGSLEATLNFANGGGYGLLLGWSNQAEATAPTNYSDILFGIIVDTSALSGSGVPRFRVVENGSITSNVAITWAQGDKLKLTVEGNSYKAYKNGNVFLVSVAGNVKYPLIPKALAYEVAQPLEESLFSVGGAQQDTRRNKVHWKNMVNVRLNSSDDLLKTAGGNDWNAGAFSIENFVGAGYVECTFNATSANRSMALGLAQADTDQHYNTMIYAMTMADSTITGNGSHGFYPTEYGTLMVGAFVPCVNGDRLRLSLEADGIARFYKNGVLVYTGISSPAAPTARWYVDSTLWGSDNTLAGVRYGAYGARGRGWQIRPDGSADFALGVTVGGSKLTSMRARSIGAIGDDLRYRGNDLGAPLESRLNASHFRLGTLRTFENEIYTELIIDIPESILLDSYANFDSVRRARVRVYNVFGTVVSECEQAFDGRGKFVIGVHTRDYADPIDQAVFSVEFRNAFGWSRPVFWSNATGGTNAWSATYWNWSGNGTVTPPTWRKRSDFPTNLRAEAFSQTGVQLSWTPAVTNGTGGANFSVWVRQHQKGNQRAAWILVQGGLASTTNRLTLSTLSPNTEYEFIAQGGGGYEWSNIAVARTFPTPPAALPTRAAPTGLSVALEDATSVRLTWVRNASDNTGVTVWVNGSQVSSEAAALLTKVVGGLTPGNTYRFAVRNTWGVSPTSSDFSNEVQFTVPSTGIATANDPSTLAALVTGSGNSVRLSWSKNSGDLAEVQRSLDAGSSWSTLTTLGAGVTTYDDIAVGYDMRVQYRVRNTSGGNSGWSNVADLYTLPNYRNDPERWQIFA